MIFSLASAQMAFHLRLYVLYIVWVFSFTIVLHRYFYFVVVTTGRECVCVFFSFFCLDHLLFRFGFLYSLFPIRSTSSHCSHRNEITFVMKMYTYICICVGYMCKQRVLYFVGIRNLYILYLCRCIWFDYIGFWIYATFSKCMHFSFSRSMLVRKCNWPPLFVQVIGRQRTIRCQWTWLIHLTQQFYTTLILPPNRN